MAGEAMKPWRKTWLLEPNCQSWSLSSATLDMQRRASCPRSGKVCKIVLYWALVEGALVERGDKQSRMKTGVCTQHSVRRDREEGHLLGGEGLRDGCGERRLGVGTQSMRS